MILGFCLLRYVKPPERGPASAAARTAAGAPAAHRHRHSRRRAAALRLVNDHYQRIETGRRESGTRRSPPRCASRSPRPPSPTASRTPAISWASSGGAAGELPQRPHALSDCAWCARGRLR